MSFRFPFELQIGLRYTRAGSRGVGHNGFISFISALSMAGIALGVAALITVLSVINGFQKEVRDRMLGVISHIEVIAGTAPLTDWQRVLADARRNPRVLAGAPFVSGQVMLVRDDTVRGVQLRGIDPEREAQVTEFALRTREGDLAALRPGEFGVAIGAELARQAGVAMGDSLALVAARGGSNLASALGQPRRFTVVALFEAGHYEYDAGLILVNLQDAASLLGITGVSGVRLKTSDLLAAPVIADELTRQLTGDLYVRDWSSENRNWFLSVQIQKRLISIILVLIVAVAAFNLVSMLVMTVTDKQGDISILRTLGASRASLMTVFVVQGSMIGLAGTAGGIGLGVLLSEYIGPLVALVERTFGFRVLEPGIYFIDHLPSDLAWADVGQIALVSIALSLLATLYPSWRAAQVQPAVALRYE